MEMASDVAIHDYEIIIIIIVVVVVVVSDDDDKSCTFEDVVKTQLDLQSYFSVYEKIQNKQLTNDSHSGTTALSIRPYNNNCIK